MKLVIGGWLCLVVGLVVACSSSDDTGGDGSQTPSGTIALGEACRSNTDCASVDGRVVKCRCTDAKDVPVCVALQKAGEPCPITGNFQKECEPGAVCSGSLNGDETVCVKQANQGELCAGELSAECSWGYSCVDGTCKRGEGTLGVECFLDADCIESLRCTKDRTCAPRIAIGESCADQWSSDSQCVEGAWCDLDTKKCTALAEDGRDCVFDQGCKSGECSFGICGNAGRIPDDTVYKCGF
ncbi:MAG: hypothetical protein QM784_15015 [Polyangiaceae bacterium]